MRIFEIDDADELWAAISQVDLEVDKRYEYAKYILQTLLQSRSARRNAEYLPTVDEIENDFIWILNQQFTNDESTISLKSKTAGYLDEIRRLKGML